MTHRPLIIGIDPGTTSAYACIDLDADAVCIRSAKGLDLSAMIMEISNKGLPLIVSSDKSNTPDFVRQFAAKTGARLTAPKEDMLVTEKRAMTKGYATVNDHERDALAAALDAYRSNRTLIRKMQRHIEIHNLQQKKNRIAYLVLAKSLSLSLASSLAQEPKKKDNLIIENAVKKKHDTTISSRILERLHRLSEQAGILKEENISLKKELRLAKKENLKIMLKVPQQTNDISKDHIIKNKDDEKEYFKKMTQDLRKKLKRIAKENKKLISIATSPGSFIPARRIKRLSMENYCKIADYVGQDDILCIDDLSSYSPKALDQLKDKSTIIISNNPPAEIRKRFYVLEEKHFKVLKTHEFCFIDKASFDKARERLDMLEKVISNYKKQRKNI